MLILKRESIIHLKQVANKLFFFLLSYCKQVTRIIPRLCIGQNASYLYNSEKL